MARPRAWLWIVLAVVLVAGGLRWCYVEANRNRRFKFEQVQGEQVGQEAQKGQAASGDCRTRMPMAMANGPMAGVRSTLEVKRLGGGPQKAFWVSISLSGGYWIQTGYLEGGGSKAFSFCFENGRSDCPTANRKVIGAMPTLQNGYTAFAIRNVGGTLWHVSIGNVDVEEYDFHVGTGTDVILATEAEYSCTNPHFPTVRAFPALEFWDGATWASAPTATSGWDLAWGVEGRLQNPALSDNEVRMGSAIPVVPPGTVLWGTP